MTADPSATAWENLAVNPDLTNFAAIRQQYGSQAEMAEALGLYDAAIISKFENGLSQIDKRTYSLFLLLTGYHPHYELQIKNDAADEAIAIAPPEGEAIAATRKFAGLTQGKLAFLGGFMSKTKPNRPLISDYENGRASPSPQSWGLLLLSMGLHPNYEVYPKLDGGL